MSAFTAHYIRDMDILSREMSYLN